MDDAARKRALREISTLARLSHPHIVDFHEAIETDSHIYVIMEYVKNGELFDFIKENGPLPEELAAFFFYQIVEAIAYCHSRNYVHRDLKPENFLLDATWGIKVSDFGFCRHVSPDHARDIRTACGSATYAAPEIFRGQPYDRSVDVWSLGVNLYVLVSGMNPWGEKSYRRQKWRILNAEYAKLDGISPECSDIIARMIKADPESRPSLTQLLTHPWFKRAESRLAEYNMVHNIVRPSLSRGSSRHHSRTPSPTTVRTRIFSSASDGSSRGRASSGGARPSSGLSRGAESASSREQGASSGAHNSSTNRSRDQGAADDSEPPVDDVLSEVLQANRQGTSSVPASDAAPNQTKTQGSIADPQPSTVATPTTTTTTTTTTQAAPAVQVGKRPADDDDLTRSSTASSTSGTSRLQHHQSTSSDSVGPQAPARDASRPAVHTIVSDKKDSEDQLPADVKTSPTSTARSGSSGPVSLAAGEHTSPDTARDAAVSSKQPQTSQADWNRPTLSTTSEPLAASGAPPAAADAPASVPTEGESEEAAPVVTTSTTSKPVPIRNRGSTGPRQSAKDDHSATESSPRESSSQMARSVPTSGSASGRRRVSSAAYTETGFQVTSTEISSHASDSESQVHSVNQVATDQDLEDLLGPLYSSLARAQVDMADDKTPPPPQPSPNNSPQTQYKKPRSALTVSLGTQRATSLSPAPPVSPRSRKSSVSQPHNAVLPELARPRSNRDPSGSKGQRTSSGGHRAATATHGSSAGDSGDGSGSPRSRAASGADVLSMSLPEGRFHAGMARAGQSQMKRPRPSNLKLASDNFVAVSGPTRSPRGPPLAAPAWASNNSDSEDSQPNPGGPSQSAARSQLRPGGLSSPAVVGKSGALSPATSASELPRGRLHASSLDASTMETLIRKYAAPGSGPAGSGNGGSGGSQESQGVQPLPHVRLAPLMASTPPATGSSPSPRRDTTSTAVTNTSFESVATASPNARNRSYSMASPTFSATSVHSSPGQGTPASAGRASPSPIKPSTPQPPLLRRGSSLRDALVATPPSTGGRDRSTSDMGALNNTLTGDHDNYATSLVAPNLSGGSNPKYRSLDGDPKLLRRATLSDLQAHGGKSSHPTL
eukprot:TRINITY_DN136_c0_g1_i1.p1 TRINITY_DN136_c0_g1~~TRINITY_DN136_c0_g1_i1.p1  ORF type:complete len:1114 (+),score=197.62 TRINITY_DN136_c0_g1_i1:126-3467(+)